MHHNNPIWHIAFHSGMTSKSDLRAAVDEGVSVGVVALKVTLAQKILVLPRFLNSGGKVFVDSGAFTVRSQGGTMDWTKVFRLYEFLLDMTDQPNGLSIVAPDVVGDQVRTLALWEEHAGRVRAWIEAGARVIIPLQFGDLSAAELLVCAKRIFGTDRFCVGIPSNLDALGLEDCASLFHHDFHILGRVVLDKDLQAKLEALKLNNPLARYTADANWLRSRTAKMSQVKPQPERAPYDYRPRESKRTHAVRQLLRREAFLQTGDSEPN